MKAPGRACLGTKPGAKIGSWGRLTKMPTFQQLAVALGRFKVALAHRPVNAGAKMHRLAGVKVRHG